MTDFPREMRQGDVVSATEYNRLVRCLRRLALIQGPGVKLSFRPNGTVVSAAVPSAVAAASAIQTLQPWTFRCTISEDGNGDEVREGGWLCPRLQFGYRLVVGPDDHAPSGTASFTAEELAQTADGEYFVVCNANDGTFALVRDYAGAKVDYSRGIIAFHVGTVADGVQTFAPHMTPVFYYNV